MGRELKRVPLDFAWPLSKRWGGYINPFSSQRINCPACEGRHGSSVEAQLLRDRWYGTAPFKPEDRGSVPIPLDHPHIVRLARFNTHTEPSHFLYQLEAERLQALFNGCWMHHLNQDDVDALAKAERLREWTHAWDEKKRKWVPTGKPNPTPAEVNEWSLRGFGHDSGNGLAVIEAELKRLGQPEQCAACKGTGTMWPLERIKRQHARWQREGPPAGPGYQIWETVSEGSPISPVFATPEELAEYMSHTRWGADQGSSKETWLKFIVGPGWAPSAVSIGGKFMSGVEASIQ